MSNKKIFLKINDRVALENDIKYRGVVVEPINQNYGSDNELCTVKWDNDGMFQYVRGALITEEIANEIQAKQDADKKIIADKFSVIAESKK